LSWEGHHENVWLAIAIVALALLWWWWWCVHRAGWQPADDLTVPGGQKMLCTGETKA
jgi:hypothetical protein